MKNSKIWVILIFLGGVLVFFYYTHQAVQNPSSFWWNNGSDPLKSYYLPAYYMKYDTGYMCTGFNYPYGEHAVYADIQAAITFPLNWIDNHIIPLQQHFGIIMLFFLFGSVFFAAFLLYKILQLLDLPDTWAAFGAILIVWLSPQWIRLPVHYGLSYMWTIPLAWYALLRYSQVPKAKWLLLLSLGILASGLLHMYNTLIVGSFVIAYALLAWLERKAYWKKSLALLSTVLVPIIFIQLFLKFTDPFHTDRPEIPWGFYHYMAEPESIFLPQYGAVRDVLRSCFFYANVNIEGWAYIGLVAVFVCLALIFRFFRRLKGREFAKLRRFSTHQDLNRSLLAAFLILLFSMGVPFVWGLSFLLDLVPPLKQFRSLGRFAWVFYYVFTAFTIRYLYVLYRSLAKRRRKSLGLVLLLISISFWFVEGNLNILHFKWAYRRAKQEAGVDRFNYEALLAQKGYKVSDFQAILFFPYAHMGSEKLGMHRGDLSLQQGVYASYQLGMPIITTFSSRTSLSQSLKLIQLLSKPVIEKEVLQELPSDKPILLITTSEKMSEAEQILIDKSEPICTYDQYQLLKLPLSAFASTRLEHIERAQSLAFQALTPGFSWATADSSAWAPIPRLFQKQASIAGLSLEDGVAASKQGKYYQISLYEGTLPFDTASTKALQFGIWHKCSNTVPYMPRLRMEVFDQNGDSLWENEYINDDKHMDVYGSWVLYLNSFPHVNPHYKYRFYMEFEYPFEVANFLIKAPVQDIYIRHGQDLYFNFYPLF